MLVLYSHIVFIEDKVINLKLETISDQRYEVIVDKKTKAHWLRWCMIKGKWLWLPKKNHWLKK